MAQIIIQISPKGKVEVEAEGTKGAGCEALTRVFEEALGRQTEKTYKPERWMTDEHAQAQG